MTAVPAIGPEPSLTHRTSGNHFEANYLLPRPAAARLRRLDPELRFRVPRPTGSIRQARSSNLTAYNLFVPYHVWIIPTKVRGRGHTWAVNKDAEWIEQHVVGPHQRGERIFISGRTFSWGKIQQIRIFQKGLVSEQEPYLASNGKDVTEQFLTGPPGQASSAGNPDRLSFAADRKAVMVIYGHDHEANLALFDWLRSIGLKPQEWSQLIHASGSASPYIGDVLSQAFKEAQVVIAFFTPDERVQARSTSPASTPTWRLQARPNVLIEAGMALVTHPRRTVLVVLGNQELPSDLAGRHYIRLSPASTQALHALASRLHDAGCDIDQTGEHWLNPTRFPERDNLPGNRRRELHSIHQKDLRQVTRSRPSLTMIRMHGRT